MRRYLKEFLSDPRVIEENRLKWWLMLNVHHPDDPARPQGQGLRQDLEPRAQRIAAARRSRARRPRSSPRCSAPCDTRVMVDWAMRYGNPSIAVAARRAAAGRLRPHPVVPLYPQYCAATTATVGDKAFDALKDHALAAGGAHRAAVARRPGLHRGAGAVARGASSPKLAFKPEVILASFHGMPQDYLDKGDPYHCQCHKTARLLRERLGHERAAASCSRSSRASAPPSGSSPTPTRP